MLLSYILMVKPILGNIFYEQLIQGHEEMFEFMLGYLRGLNYVRKRHMIQKCFNSKQTDAASTLSSTMPYESKESKEMNEEIDEKSDMFNTNINVDTCRRQIERLINVKWMVVPSPIHSEPRTPHWIASWHLNDLFRSCRNLDKLTESQQNALDFWKNVSDVDGKRLRRSRDLQPFLEYFQQHAGTFEERIIPLFDQMLDLIGNDTKPNQQLPIGFCLFVMMIQDPEHLFLLRKWKYVHLFAPPSMGLLLKDSFWSGFAKIFTLLVDDDFYGYYETRCEMVQQNAIVQYLMDAGPQQRDSTNLSTYSLWNFIVTLQYIAEQTHIFRYVSGDNHFSVMKIMIMIV